MNVLIADPTTKITERLKDIIASENKTAVIYTTTNYQKALAIFTENKPSITLLGINSTSDNVLQFLQAIKDTGHATSVIVLYIHITKPVIEQCKALGATVFLDKFLDFEKIPGLINAVLKKVSPKVINKN